MKKISMMLCIVLAIGWISNTGYLSLQYENGLSISGIKLIDGYEAHVKFRGTLTKVSATVVPLSVFGLGHNAMVYVNDKWIQATPLGNGFMFKFDEVKGDSSEVKHGARGLSNY